MEAVILVRREKRAVLDLFGSTVEFLTLPEKTDADYCVIIGTVPPGGSVTLHSHSHPESFFVLSGSLQALLQRVEKFEWMAVKPGEFVHVASSAKHAWRNTSSEPAVALVTTTAKLVEILSGARKTREPWSTRAGSDARGSITSEAHMQARITKEHVKMPRGLSPFGTATFGSIGRLLALHL